MGRGQHVGGRIFVGHARTSPLCELRLIDYGLGGILSQQLVRLEEGDLGRSIRTLLQREGVLDSLQILLIAGTEGDAAGGDYSVGGAHLDDEANLLVLVLPCERVVKHLCLCLDRFGQ